MPRSTVAANVATSDRQMPRSTVAALTANDAPGYSGRGLNETAK